MGIVSFFMRTEGRQRVPAVSEGRACAAAVLSKRINPTFPMGIIGFFMRIEGQLRVPRRVRRLRLCCSGSVEKEKN